MSCAEVDPAAETVIAASLAVACAFLLQTAVLWFFESAKARTTPRSRIRVYISIIVLECVLTYAWILGKWTPALCWRPETGVYASPEPAKRTVWPIRYVFWSVACAQICHMLGYLGRAQKRYVAAGVGSAALVPLLGLATEYTPRGSAAWWAALLGSCAGNVCTIAFLFPALRRMRAVSASDGSYLRVLHGTVLTLWQLFPVLWALAVSGAISSHAESVTWPCLDVGCKAFILHACLLASADMTRSEAALQHCIAERMQKAESARVPVGKSGAVVLADAVDRACSTMRDALLIRHMSLHVSYGDGVPVALPHPRVVDGLRRGITVLLARAALTGHTGALLHVRVFMSDPDTLRVEVQGPGEAHTAGFDDVKLVMPAESDTLLAFSTAAERAGARMSVDLHAGLLGVMSLSLKEASPDPPAATGGSFETCTDVASCFTSVDIGATSPPAPPLRNGTAVLLQGHAPLKADAGDGSGSPNPSEAAGDVRTWAFDALMLPAEALVPCMVRMVDLSGALEPLGIETRAVADFLRAVVARYLPHPYHNAWHAVAVMHLCFMVATSAERAVDALGPLERLALLLGAACHDVGHTGVTNAYETSAVSELAIRYSDRSVLEQHHAAVMFELLQPGLRRFVVRPGLPSEEVVSVLGMRAADFAAFRRLSIAGILATDTSRHSEMLQAVARLREDTATAADIMPALLHAADVGSSVLPSFPIARMWADLVCEELSQQVDAETARGLPSAPHMVGLRDNAVAQARMQLDFIDGLVAPLWTQLALALPELACATEALNANRARWEAVAAGVER